MADSPIIQVRVPTALLADFEAQGVALGCTRTELVLLAILRVLNAPATPGELLETRVTSAAQRRGVR